MEINLPNHIAIIPDGNRRWAKEHHLPSIEGHRRGADVAVKISRKVRSLGIHTLTLWAFSTENWNRPPKEVSYLMVLYERMLQKYFEEAMKDNVRINHIGRKDRLPEKLRKMIVDVESKTEQFQNYQLNIALDYGGRDEILRAIKKMNDSGVDEHSLDESSFSAFLDTGNQQYPDPDIIIRTSGEQRTSGIMIWQAAYAEYFFLDKYFPEFTDEDLENIITDYGHRQRRFGK